MNKINNLIYKYKNLPIQVKATFWFVGCQAVQSGCKFLSMPFLVRILTSEQYGIYNVFLSWLQIISLFATLNLHCGSYNNAMLKYPNKHSSYTSSVQSLAFVCSFLCLVFYLLFYKILNPFFDINPVYILLMFIQILFSESFMLWSACQKYEYKYKSLLIYTALLAVLYMFMPIIVGMFFPQEKRLTAVIVSGVIVQSIFGFLFLIYNYLKGRNVYDKEFWTFSLKFNIPLIPHFLSTIILGQADRLMIKKIIGASEAGIYSFTYNISLIINIITTSINNAMVPYIYEKMKNKDYKKLNKISIFLLFIIGIMCLAFSTIAPELIKIFATPEYYDAISLVPIISLSSYFIFLYTFFGNIELYFEKTKFISAASFTIAIVNIILNYIFIPIFGYFAAGYTTLFCYVLFSFVHYIFMQVVCKRKLNGDKLYNGFSIFLISIMFVILGFLLMIIYRFPFIRYILIFIFLYLFFINKSKIKNMIYIIKHKES